MQALSYKHIQRPTAARQLLVVSGVFLWAFFGFNSQASALGADIIESKPIEITLIDQNKAALNSLKDDFEFKATLIQEKSKELEHVTQEVEKIAQTKEELAHAVESARHEVDALKARLAEKKRLEALRIVPPSKYAADSAGNTYAPGNCTYYVKNKRPDLSNSLGNANTWYYRAKALGYRVGTMAKTGAVGTTTAGALGHVVYVEKWLGNGLILISEMNVSGLWSTQTRVASETDFTYIYEL